MAAIVGGLLLITLALSVLYLTATRRIASLEPEAGDALPPNVPGRFVRVGSHRVHVVERGDGPAILLVPGTGGTTLDWETSVLDDLGQDHRVVALDLYGMGFSDRDDAFAYGVTLWADQLVGTLDALGLDRVSVIGQSLGGAIALVFAGRYPPRVNRAVSVDSGPWMPAFMLLLVRPGVVGGGTIGGSGGISRRCTPSACARSTGSGARDGTSCGQSAVSSSGMASPTSARCRGCSVRHCWCTGRRTTSYPSERPHRCAA